MNRKRTNNWRGVFYLATLAILLTPARTSAELPLYISPGLQIGSTPSKGVSVSIQITLGTLIEVLPTDQPPDLIPLLVPGVTLGTRFSKGETMLYLDGQISQMIVGVGLGRVWIKQKGAYSYEATGFRFKAWAGWLLLLTYDRTMVRGLVPGNHFGLMGVLPMPLGDWWVPSF